MEIFQHAITQMLMLFAIIACGFIARKKKMMDEVFDARLSALVMNFTLPALILSSVLSSSDLPSDEDMVRMLGYAALYFVIACSLAAVIVRVCYRGVPRDACGAHAFMMVFGNTGFLGFAVLAAVFGPDAVLYGAIFNIMFNLAMFSVGMWFIAATGREGSAPALRKRHDFKAHARAAWSILTKPAMLASYAAMALALLRITDSGPIGQTCGILGGMTVPAAMLVIGSSLASMPLRDMFSDAWSYVTSAIRLVLVPLGVFGLFGLFVHDPYILAILVVIAAMPVASNGTMLCLAYGGDTKTMARGTFLTTIASLLTLPMIALLVV